MLTSLHVPISHLYIVFWKMSIRFSAQFPSCGLFDINLYELFMCFGILIPSRSYLCRYFTPFSRLPFPVVGDSPCCAQAFAFKDVPFVYFCFIYLGLRDRSKKYCSYLCHRMFGLCLLVGVLGFQVLHLGV